MKKDLFYLPCLPPVSWCRQVQQSLSVVLEVCEHYTKGSWRNRYAIAGPNGPQLLSVPLLKGKHQQKPIREVRISYEVNWQRQHWRSICTAYGNAPYFEHYADAVRPFYERHFEFLFDYNAHWLQFLCDKWKWPLSFEYSQRYVANGGWQSGRDYRQAWPTGNLRPYPQVFSDRHGFLPDLSALDLLFCCGPHATDSI